MTHGRALSDHLSFQGRRWPKGRRLQCDNQHEAPDLRHRCRPSLFRLPLFSWICTVYIYKFSFFSKMLREPCCQPSRWPDPGFSLLIPDGAASNTWWPGTESQRHTETLRCAAYYQQRLFSHTSKPHSGRLERGTTLEWFRAQNPAVGV